MSSSQAASGVPAAPTAGRRRGTPRLVLALGFGGLLACILAAAADTLSVLDRVRGEEAHTRKLFLLRLGLLNQIRGQIYLSGTYVRDFLLSPDAGGAAAEVSRLAAAEAETRTALEIYGRNLEPEEKTPFLSMRGEIESYWRVLNRMAAWSPEERKRQRDAFFYQELVPRRTAMLQVADRVGTINEQGLARAEERLAASSGRMRRSFVLVFGLTVAGGLVLALATIGYTLRLDRELQRRLEENARARADLEDLSARLVRAQENERRALARELHDEIGQALSAVLIETEGAECAAAPEEAREHLASIRALAEKTVNQVRDLALLLRPSMLDDFGLIPALNWYARETGKRTGLDVTVSAGEETDDLPDEHKTCIYRLVQEAVNNAARHASARRVEVAVEHRETGVVLRVRDDGAGFDARVVRGLGILGMEERVRRLGGSLTIESKPGRGTLVQAELPLSELARKSTHAAYSNSVG